MWVAISFSVTEVYPSLLWLFGETLKSLQNASGGNVPTESI